MSDTRLLQRNPNAADAGPYLSENIWEIWVSKESLLPNHPMYNQPGKFIQIGSKIYAPSELVFQSSSLDESPQHRVEYIFCRQGVTSEQLDPSSGFGCWEYQNYSVMNISEWKKKCEILRRKNLNRNMPGIYGVKVDHSPNASKFFWWMAHEGLKNPRIDANGNFIYTE